MEHINSNLAKTLEVFGITKLNAVQTVAAQYGLFSKKDIGIVSQSRTGKSFAGALAVANEIFITKEQNKDKKNTILPVSIFITPYHASARDLFSIISKYFGWFLKPVLLLGESQETEILIRVVEKNFNLIISTPESIISMLRNKDIRAWLRDQTLESVIFDDVHSILYDTSRGINLFEISNFFKHSMPNKPRFVVLSAHFNKAKRLEKIFDINLIIDPTEYKAPDINLVNYKSSKEKKKLLQEQLTELASKGVTTLVFMNRISHLESLLKKYGESLGELIAYDIDPMIQDRLTKVAQNLEELDYPYATLVKFGIGSNHGIMEDEQRWFIEWAFRHRYIRFLFGTQTFAYGVNTPVRHVVLGSPGLNEIFRQSMMARAIWMRQGKNVPGTCTIYSKTILKEEKLKEVFYNPHMPKRRMKVSRLSAYTIGLIGAGILTDNDSVKKLERQYKLFFKWASITREVQKLLKADRSLIHNENDVYELTTLGKIAYKTYTSKQEIKRILEGIELLGESDALPTDFDLLVLLSHVIQVDFSNIIREGKELDHALTKFLDKKIQSSFVDCILDTEKESRWRLAIRYAINLYSSINEDTEISASTRKTTDRVKVEIKRFSPRFRGFLVGLIEEDVYVENTHIQDIVTRLISHLDSKRFTELVIQAENPHKYSFKGTDLSFVDFSDITTSIDKTLSSDLNPYQKIQLLELLDSVDSTTSTFVNLMAKAKDDRKAQEILDLVCTYTDQSQLGMNLIKSLEQEGLLEPSAFNQLIDQINQAVDTVKEKTKAPASATKILYSLFTGNLAGAAMETFKAVQPLFKPKKVDTDGIE